MYASAGDAATVDRLDQKQAKLDKKRQDIVNFVQMLVGFLSHSEVAHLPMGWTKRFKDAVQIDSTGYWQLEVVSTSNLSGKELVVTYYMKEDDRGPAFSSRSPSIKRELVNQIHEARALFLAGMKECFPTLPARYQFLLDMNV